MPMLSLLENFPSIAKVFRIELVSMVAIHCLSIIKLFNYIIAK